MRYNRTKFNNHAFNISLIVSMFAVLWLVGAFVTFDLTWFITTIAGRCVAIVELILVMNAAIKALKW